MTTFGELAKEPRWLLWQLVPVPGDKPKKVPHYANGTLRRGKLDGPDDRARLVTFDAAQHAARKVNGQDFAVGLAIFHPLVFIDLDDCLNERLEFCGTDEQREIYEAAREAGALIALSQSQRGYHIIGVCSEQVTYKRKLIEIYTHGRFCAWTGAIQQNPDGPLPDLTELIRRFATPKRSLRLSPSGSSSSVSDAELLDHARRGRNGQKFAALFDRGDTSDYEGDDSRADLALAGLLAFWVGPDPARIERFFTASALGQRDKWRQRADYRERTISAAIAGRTKFWSGRARMGRTQNRADLKAPVITDTDMANAQRLATRHGRDMYFTAEAGWSAWDSRRWTTDEKAVRIQALAKDTALAIFHEVPEASNPDRIVKHAKHSQSKQAIEAMTWLARSEPGIYTTLAEFDTDPLLFNVTNGTLDLRTGELRPHSRDNRITKLSPVRYDADGDCELWDSFVRRVTGEREELYGYLQRLTGYLLTGLTTEQVVIFLHGLGGNGKTVFCEVLQAMLGEYAIAVLPELVMARKHSGIPNDVAALCGRRVALMNETSQGSRFDEAKLKHLTGSDSLTGRFLHREFFTFEPTHKLVIRGNHKPAISGTDEGIWRRLHLVPFDVHIPPAEQDMNLLHKLKAELPGILRWAGEGCLAWQREGLRPPEMVLSAVNRYRAESDTLGRFIEEQCETKNLAEVKSSNFFSAYQTFCERSAERWIPARDLPAEMERRGFRHQRKMYGRVYLGIQLRTSDGPGWCAA